MEALLAERRRRLDAGERSLGWKLGFGTGTAMERLGIDAPLIGWLPASARLEPGATAAVSPWSAARLEPEIAVHLGADVPAGAACEEAAEAVAAVGTAIELVEPDPDAADPEAILRANIFHRHVVLAAPDGDRRTADGVIVRVLRNGAEEAGTEDPRALTGDHLDLVRHVADTLAGFGERLGAGEVVITGSTVPALAVAAGDEVEVEMPPLAALRVGFR